MDPIDTVAVADLLRLNHDRTAGVDATRLLRAVQVPGCGFRPMVNARIGAS
jgi:hypothetical protein